MKIVIEESKLPDGTTEADLQVRFETMRDTGNYIRVGVEERETGPVQVIIRPSWPDIFALHQQGTTPAKFFADKDIDQLLSDFDSNKNLGVLSAKYESNGDPGAFGEDDAGGHSYGAYQLASKEGSVGNFIVFLEEVKPDYAKILNDAGGETAAKGGTAVFKAAWTTLAANEDFLTYQHGFIKSTYYDVLVGELENKLVLKVEAKSFALKNVVWSTAVHHGPAGGRNVFKNALTNSGLTADAASDEELIRAVYTERSNVGKYFPRVPGLHGSLQTRFSNEMADALAMLDT